MTGNRPYHNEASQHEKRAITANDRRVHADASTYADHAHDDNGGRWQKQTPGMAVGEKPTIDYPAGAQWTRDRGPEADAGLPASLASDFSELACPKTKLDAVWRLSMSGTSDHRARWRRRRRTRRSARRRGGTPSVEPSNCVYAGCSIGTSVVIRLFSLPQNVYRPVTILRAHNRAQRRAT